MKTITTARVPIGGMEFRPKYAALIAKRDRKSLLLFGSTAEKFVTAWLISLF